MSKNIDIPWYDQKKAEFVKTLYDYIGCSVARSRWNNHLLYHNFKEDKVHLKLLKKYTDILILGVSGDNIYFEEVSDDFNGISEIGFMNFKTFSELFMEVLGRE